MTEQAPYYDIIEIYSYILIALLILTLIYFNFKEDEL